MDELEKSVLKGMCREHLVWSGVLSKRVPRVCECAAYTVVIIKGSQGRLRGFIDSELDFGLGISDEIMGDLFRKDQAAARLAEQGLVRAEKKDAGDRIVITYHMNSAGAKELGYREVICEHKL